MERNPGVYQPYYPSQQLPTAQWDDSGRQPVPQGQQQSLHGGYQYTVPQPYQLQQSHASYPQHFQQSQYGYQALPELAANQQTHYQMRYPGQHSQPPFAPSQGQYSNAQIAGGRSSDPSSGCQTYSSTSMPGGGQNQRQHRSSSSRAPTTGSNSAYGSVGSSSDGPSTYHRSSGANSGISTSHYGAAPPLGSGMSKLPAKPTFEPSGGAPLRQSPRSSVGAGLDGNSNVNAVGISGVAMTGDKPLSKSSLTMGQQLLGKLPPLPPLPVEVQRPSSLANLEPPDVSDTQRGSETAEHESRSSTAPHEAEETRQYLSSLLAVIEAYKAREDAMQMRVEALAFRPAESWRSISADMSLTDKATTTPASRDASSPTSEETTSAGQKETEDSLGPAPVLGVRLLRKVSELQKENEELGELLSRKLGLDEEEKPRSEPPKVSAEELEETRADLEDAQQLLEKLAAALKASEARAERAERALEAAVQSRSLGVLG